MEQIDYLKEEQCILGKIPAADAEKEKLAWNMMEHNEIYGLVSFEYFYLNDMVCFRYDISSYYSVSSVFRKKVGDFESVFFLCREVFRILEKSAEYLLKEENFLLKPEWIFGDFFHQKVVLCYLPGRKKQTKREVTELLEYLMEHMEHDDSRAVDFIYTLYALVAEVHTSAEEILDFIVHYEKGTKEEADKENRTEQVKDEKIWRIGREEGNDICIPFMTVSRKHLHLIQRGEDFFVMDLSSTNGTSLNGKKLLPMEKVKCTEKDILCIGGISFSLHMEPPDIKLCYDSQPFHLRMATDFAIKNRFAMGKNLWKHMCIRS